MKLHILDTDIMTLYQAGHSKVVERVDACMPRELAITVISVEEELTGWYTKLRRAKKREDLARAYQRLTEAVSFLSGARILSFTETAIMRYEDLRKSHRNMGRTIFASPRLPWKTGERSSLATPLTSRKYLVSKLTTGANKNRLPAAVIPGTLNSLSPLL